MGSGPRARLRAAFELDAQHGCLVVRDTESDGDLSDWGPETNLSFFDEGSAIFPVVPGVDGPVRCEVWQGTPKHVLPRQLLTAEFDISGALRVEDPAGVVTIELRSVRGSWMISVFGDDDRSSCRVQVVIDHAVASHEW